ncbi:MAG: type II toxin-antitoxin system HicB family antitoxin [Candidatus Xenobiia bacterium LiM19]
MRFLYVIEKAENNYSAYLPDIPGCIATGATVDEVKESLGKKDWKNYLKGTFDTRRDRHFLSREAPDWILSDKREIPWQAGIFFIISTLSR